MTASSTKLLRVDGILTRVEDFIADLCGYCILILMGLGIWQIAGRQLVDLPVPAYIDLVEISMASVTFLAIAYCQRLGGHVRMDLFMLRMPNGPRWILEVIGTAIALLIVTVLIYYGFEHAWRAYTLGDFTIDAELTIWPSKLLVPFALCLLWLRLTVQLWAFARLVGNPNAGQLAIPRYESVEETAAHEIEMTDAAPGGKGG